MSLRKKFSNRVGGGNVVLGTPLCDGCTLPIVMEKHLDQYVAIQFSVKLGYNAKKMCENI